MLIFSNLKILESSNKFYSLFFKGARLLILFDLNELSSPIYQTPIPAIQILAIPGRVPAKYNPAERKVANVIGVTVENTVTTVRTYSVK